MKQGKIHIYSGDGHGKTPAALGEALYAASEGKTVVVIQFLKADHLMNAEYLKRLEPEIKFFRFEKSSAEYASLDEAAREEEKMNIRNGLNFAKKVLSTGECDLLILDEVLGLIDKGILTVEELKTLLEAGDGDTELMLTGIRMYDELYPYVDEVFRIDTLK